MALPEPEHEKGYTSKEVENICKERKISPKDFSVAFGVNTCLLIDGKVIYYKCDVERALHKLGKKDGKWHAWD